MARRSMEVVAAMNPDMRAAIAERAYYKAELRGFEPGHDVEDWLTAERELTAFVETPSKSKRKSAAVKKLK